MQNGGREARPSRMEVLSILLKNPHHHSLPHAVPVHCLNGSYQVVGFDGSTTVAEFLRELHGLLGTARPFGQQSGFAIFSDDPLEKDLDHALDASDKVCDVISRWETALREKGMGRFENNRAIRFIFKNRLFWRRNVPGESDKERLLLSFQTAREIAQGRFPVSRDLALELAALMAQVTHGDLTADRVTSSVPAEALDRFFPARYRTSAAAAADDGGAALDHDDHEDDDDACQVLCERWAALKGRSAHDCVRIFLTCTRKWPFFGAKLFQVQVSASRHGGVVSSNLTSW